MIALLQKGAKLSLEENARWKGNLQNKKDIVLGKYKEKSQNKICLHLLNVLLIIYLIHAYIQYVKNKLYTNASEYPLIFLVV
jgi:hypothetical protein